jgi:hypothetical protein
MKNKRHDARLVVETFGLSRYVAGGLGERAYLEKSPKSGALENPPSTDLENQRLAAPPNRKPEKGTFEHSTDETSGNPRL